MNLYSVYFTGHGAHSSYGGSKGMQMTRRKREGVVNK